MALTPPQKIISYDLVIIGGGSAGLTAAKFASTFSKSSVIIEKDKMGGDCTWTGCVPSKTLLSSAKAVHVARHSKEFGVTGGANVGVNLEQVRDRIRNKIDLIYKEDDSPEAMERLGIDTLVGRAEFVSSKVLRVLNDKDEGDVTEVHAKEGIVIATGAKAVRPVGKIPGLEDVKYITYEEVFELEGLMEGDGDVPKKLTVVGGGPIGCELAQGLSRLGAVVTIVASRLLPNEEPEASEAMSRIFASENIQHISGRVTSVAPNNNNNGHIATTSNGENVTGDILLVAAGRVPVVDGMNLDGVGVKLLKGKGGIEVDKKLRTSVKGVYAAGDCTGEKQFTHYAGFQGVVAARNILLPLSDPGVLDDVPATTFTDPEVASVGMTEQQAKNTHGSNSVLVSYRPLTEVDRAITESKSEEGFIKVVYKKKGYKILGATIVAPVAGEMISEIGVAMKNGMSFDMLATVVHSYPSYSIALQQMAGDVYYDKLKKSKMLFDFLKMIGL